MKRARFLASRSQGFTLVELVIAMLILGAIAGVGSRAFLSAQRAHRESLARSRAAQDLALLARSLEQDAAHLYPDRVGKRNPYAELIDPTTGLRTYQLMTRLSERDAWDSQSALATAALVEYRVERDRNGLLRLTRSRAFVGPGDLLGEAKRGTLMEGIRAFSLAPQFAAGPGTEEFPVGFRAQIEQEAGTGENVPVSLFCPTRATPPQEGREENRKEG